MKKTLTISFFFFLQLGYAQVQEQLSPEERKQLTKITEPITLYKGFLRLRTSVQYTSFDKFFDDQGKSVSYPTISGSGTLLFFSIQYGITDRLEAEVVLSRLFGSIESSYNYQIPYTGDSGIEYSKIGYSGLTDSYVSLRYQVLRDKPGTPAIMLGLSSFLPTGKRDPSDYTDSQNYQAPVAKGEFGVGPEVRIRKIAYPFSFELGFSYIKYFGSDKILQPDAERVNVISGPELLIRPQINFHLNDWVSLTHYVDYYHAAKDSFDGEDAFGTYNNKYDQWVCRYYPGITFQIKRFRLEQAVLIPLAGKVNPADPSYFFGVDYIF